jgi:hypothetical protein
MRLGGGREVLNALHRLQVENLRRRFRSGIEISFPRPMMENRVSLGVIFVGAILVVYTGILALNHPPQAGITWWLFLSLRGTVGGLLALVGILIRKYYKLLLRNTEGSILITQRLLTVSEYLVDVRQITGVSAGRLAGVKIDLADGRKIIIGKWLDRRNCEIIAIILRLAAVDRVTDRT